MTKELPKAYDPALIEQRHYEAWEREGLFGARANSKKKPFTIVIPPPNVTGALHMGHALNDTLQDVLIRRARMRGFEALWVPGTDHAGIATQNVVERELNKQGTDRHEVGREAFVERVWEWKRQYGGRIIEQLRRLGCSCDWTRERFTMDEGLSRAVRAVFVRWFDEGLIFRGLRIINWCPRCTTALSDIEVEHEEAAGELVTFRYELADGSGVIPVATTRVETMLGDTGIAVHPQDERYAGVVGKSVRHPFFPERDLPVVADDVVDPAFGTGAVKVTPAHDPVDFEIAQRQGLDSVNILDDHARTNDSAGEFRGLDRYEARQAVLHELRARGAVEKEERPYVHAVGHCYRCGTEVEPWLSEQWFVRMKPLAKPPIAAVKDGRTKFHPHRFYKSYVDWMDNVRDWCISRQIWWGHRIPVWYCDDCKEVFAALEDPTSCPKCSSSSIRQDPDVLDTWFSSQLWPFSTLGWPDETEDLKFFYPTAVLVTAYEILYLWVARMIVSGLYFMHDVPFRDVFIHGIVRDFEGKKMSKSLGNVIDPLEMIERYGADALRFSLAFVAVPGSDTNVSEDRIEGARNFANKLWNATRFVLLALGDERPELPEEEQLGVEDRWVLSRLRHTIEEVERGFAAYNFSEISRALHKFIWSEYCDWYIELSKLNLSGPRRAPTQAVLLHVLDAILRLLHPLMPFVTEELWSELRPGARRLIISSWPQPVAPADFHAEQVIDRFQDLVVALRRLKVDHGIPQAQRVRASVAAGEHAAEARSLEPAIAALARLESVDLVRELPRQGVARVVTGSGMEAAVDLGEVLDVDVERERLNKRMQAVSSDISRAERKLSNGAFLNKAPAAVVEKERAKLQEYRAAREKLETQLKALSQ